MIRLVAPWGFYGMGNTGDEGTLCGFARLLATGGVRARAWIGSGNPAQTAHAEPAFSYFACSGIDFRRYWAKLRGEVQAVIGGTPIMDILGDWPLSDLVPLVRATDRRRLPFLVIGSGVENLQHDRSRRIVREEIVPRVRHWSVRCDRDRERLIEYGAAPGAITVAADVAWLIDPVSAEFGRAHLGALGFEAGRPTIGVNVANENSCFEQHPGMTEAVANALDSLIVRHGAQVLFLCAEVREGPTFDKAAAHHVIARMRRTDDVRLVPNRYFTPRELMSLIGCCVLTVSMRYHFCIFSALQGVPFVAIRRADKVSDLCWDLDWSASVIPPSFEAAEIVHHAEFALSDATEASGRLRRAVPGMRTRALRNLAALEALNSCA